MHVVFHDKIISKREEFTKERTRCSCSQNPVSLHFNTMTLTKRWHGLLTACVQDIVETFVMTLFERYRFHLDCAFHKLHCTCHHVLSSAKGNIRHGSTQHRHAHFFPFLDLVLYQQTSEIDLAVYRQSNKGWTYRHVSLEDALLRQRQSSQKRKKRMNIVGAIDKDSPREAQPKGRVLEYTKGETDATNNSHAHAVLSALTRCLTALKSEVLELRMI